MRRSFLTTKSLVSGATNESIRFSVSQLGHSGLGAPMQRAGGKDLSVVL